MLYLAITESNFIVKLFQYLKIEPFFFACVDFDPNVQANAPKNLYLTGRFLVAVKEIVVVYL